jgi:hypothetical protein
MVLLQLPPRLRLRIHALAVTGVGALLTVVWATTSRGFFWPIQALLPLALTVAIHGWLVLLEERTLTHERFLGDKFFAAHIGLAAAMWLYLFALWLVGDRGYFWPAWALLGIATLVGVHFVRVAARRERGETESDGERAPDGSG